MEAKEKETVKSRTQELLKEIYEDKCAIAEEHKENPKLAEEKIKTYMQTEYTKKRREIIELNFDFVVARVRTVTKGDNEQCISYAIEGFMKAIDDFEFEKGNNLLTYAQKRIDRYIKNGITYENSARYIPRKLLTSMLETLKKSGTEEKMDIEKLAKKLKTTQGTVCDMLKSLRTDTRFDAEYDDEIPYHEVISDSSLSPQEIVERKMISENLFELMERVLTPEQQYIVKAHNGFLGDPKTFPQLAKEINITRQGVEHRYKVAIKILRQYVEHSALESVTSGFEIHTQRRKAS